MQIRSLLPGIVVAGAFIVGCLAARVSPPTAVASAGSPPSVTRQRWDYHCVRYLPGPEVTLTDELKAIGRDGWEMVTAINGGYGPMMASQQSFLLCFKRPLD